MDESDLLVKWRALEEQLTNNLRAAVVDFQRTTGASVQGIEVQMFTIETFVTRGEAEVERVIVDVRPRSKGKV